VYRSNELVIARAVPTLKTRDRVARRNWKSAAPRICRSTPPQFKPQCRTGCPYFGTCRHTALGFSNLPTFSRDKSRFSPRQRSGPVESIGTRLVNQSITDKKEGLGKSFCRPVFFLLAEINS
jgi:hypothetical protein